MKLFPPPLRPRHNSRAFTLVEVLVVIIIIAILSVFAGAAYKHVVRQAYTTENVNNMRQMTSATMLWAADHGDKLPSPQYSGNEIDLPQYWDLGTDGIPGLWLNGVVYAQVYIEDNESQESISLKIQSQSNVDAGGHLVDTIFQSAIGDFGKERNFFRHSYAMNANLMYDQLAVIRGLANPWYSEKAIAKFDPSKSMLYIDCADTNIVMAENYQSIVDTANSRYDGKFALGAFLDGTVRKVPLNDIPAGGETSNREASLFWRGVLED